jgi:hypothetical protein
MKELLLGAVALIGLSACAGTSGEDVTAKLQQVTAQTIRVGDPGGILIVNQERFAAKWQWRATFQGQTYDCDADNLLRLPSCTAVAT